VNIRKQRKRRKEEKEEKKEKKRKEIFNHLLISNLSASIYPLESNILS